MKNKKNIKEKIDMNICIAADNNYASILQVVIVSILENNHFNNINFHIFESKVSSENKKRIKLLVKKYNQNVYFYDVDKYIENLKKDISSKWADNNSYVTYVRLYMPDMLPDNIKTFLYLDCDVLITGDISNIFKINMESYVMAGVKDVLPHFFKKYMGFDDGNYFNAGVLYFNSYVWKKENFAKKVLNYCLNHQSDLFPDQDALNTILKGRILTLDPKYCVFYPETDFSISCQLKGYGGNEQKYYNKKLLKDANTHHLIIHFTDSVIGRPWQNNNINPHSAEWLHYYNLLPSECKMKFSNKKLGWKSKIYRLLYKILPSDCFSIIYYIRKNKDLKNRMKDIK